MSQTDLEEIKEQNSPPWISRQVGLQTLFGVGVNQTVTSFDPASWTVGQSGLQALAEEAAGGGAE